jgi:hypothetical protein
VRSFRIGIVSGAVVVAAGLILAASPGASTADSSALSGPAVAAGTVTNPSGVAMPGVPVDLYAWPSNAVLKAMKPGQAVPTTLLTTATTNGAGKYALQVPAARLKAAAVDSGYANLEIYSASGFWFFSYQTNALTGRQPAAATVNLGGKKSKWPCGYESNGQPYPFSGWKLLRHMSPAWAVVGQGYIARQRSTKGDSVKFEYTQGSSHTQTSSLGVGISGYGIDAGYSSSGTRTSTAKRSEGFPRVYRSTLFRTEFSTAEYRGECYGIPNVSVPRKKQHSSCPKKHDESYVHMCLWMVASTSWFGGATMVHPKGVWATPAKNCAKQQKGTSFNTDYGTAVDWSREFQLGAALHIKGINLKASFSSTAQTGYDSNALLDYKYGQTGYICGTNGPPSSAAVLVQRGNRG